MKAQDISAYFTKKIARAINYDALLADEFGDQVRRAYSVEVTAVSDEVVHAVVNFRYAVQREVKGGTPYYCGEVILPVWDGDTIETVLDMAIADADPQNVCVGVVHVGDDPSRMRRAFRRVRERSEDLPLASKPGL